MMPSRGVCLACRVGGYGSTRSLPAAGFRRQFSGLASTRSPISPSRSAPSPILSSRSSWQTSPGRLVPAVAIASQIRYKSNTSETIWDATSSSSPDALPPDPLLDPASFPPDIIEGASSGVEQWHLGFLTEQLGHFGYLPFPFTESVKWLFEHILVYSGTESVGFAIIITAMVIRLGTLPLVQKASDTSAKLKKINHLIEPLKERMKKAAVDKDQRTMSEARQEQFAIFRENGIKVRRLAYPFVQAFIGFGSWRLVRNMADLPVPGMETGGFLWFQNLCIADPYMVLPAVMALTQHMMIRFGGEMGNAGIVQARLRTALMWGFPTLSFFAVSFAPAGIQLSFCVASFLSMITGILFRNNNVRAFLKMEPTESKAPVKKAPWTPAGQVKAVREFISNLRPSKLRENWRLLVDDVAKSATGTPGGAFVKTSAERATEMKKNQVERREKQRQTRAKSEGDQQFHDMRERRKARAKN